MKKFHTLTLGCKVNQYETRSIREAWERLGMACCDDPASADVILINSCSVTANAIRDLRSSIRRLRRLSPQALIVVAGCAVQAGGGNLAEPDPTGNVLLVPQKRKQELLKGPVLAGDAPCGDTPLQWPAFSISGYERARGVVKVQDGCSHRCTYCIVPLTRGPSVSRPPAEILEEIRRLLDNGFRELGVSGINLRHYGRGLSGRDAEVGDFWGLMHFLDQALAPEWADRARLRISSLDPGQLDDRAVNVFAESPMVCPHAHLSLQSLDEGVLRKMGRGHYTYADAARFVDNLSARLPVFALGADLLTGFPGETREQFETTLKRVEELPLTYAHVFPYSRRPGTPAASYPDQTGREEKRERATRLRDVVAKKRQAFAGRLLGLHRLILAAETIDPPAGRCEYYAPCALTAAPDGIRAGQLVAGAPSHLENGVVMLTPENGSTNS